MHALLDGYDLAGFLDVATPLPEQEIVTNGVTVPNPAYVLHKRQDELLYSAVIGAISLAIQPILSKANTTADV